MALGFMGHGGSSSSSSNLSPLAPPFTVDRSNPKPNSNPLVPFTEPPYAAGHFQSSYHNWQYSDSSCNDYGYLGSQSVSSTNAHLPPLNPSVTTATETFACHEYSRDKPKNCVQTKPYYTPLVSCVVDNAIPLVALNEPSYDVLPNSCVVAPSSGNSQVDYTRSLSGLEYTPSWGGVWNNRLADEEAYDSGSFVCKEYIKQGPCTADAPSKCDEASTISRSRKRNVDVWGRRSQFVTPSTGKLSDKSSSMQDPMFIPDVSQRTSFSGMNSTLQESHAQEPSLQSATNFCSHQNSYGSVSSSYDKWFPSLGSCVNNYSALLKNSVPLVIRPPSNSTSSKMSNAATSEGLAINGKDVGRHNPSNQKEPLMSSSDGQSGCLASSGPIVHVERSNQVFNASPSTGKEELSKTTKNGKEFQLPDINVPSGFTLELDNSEGVCSAEYSSEGLDHYNPAVDSPCWKGATASCFSLSKASEAVTPEAQTCPPCADDNVKVSRPYICGNSEYMEKGYVELGSLLCPETLSNSCPTGEQTSFDVVKAGFIYPRSSSSDEVQFSYDINKKRKESDLPNDPKSDCIVKLSHAKPPDLSKGVFVPEREAKMLAGVADLGLKTEDSSKDGMVSFRGMGSTSFSPCSGENVNKPVYMNATESRQKMNVQMLVDTIRNLSELLLFQCSNDASAVSEQNHEALKLVINNLDTCVSKRIVSMTPTQKSMFTQQCTSSHPCGNLPDSNESAIAGWPPVTKDKGASCQGPFDHDSAHELKRNGVISVKVVEKFPDFISLRSNADNVKDDDMVQAIKGVLEKDFSCEEETQPETLLYKNLWLEAEAALCSLSYRARFNRMKVEMEKCKSYKAKDVAVDQLLNSKVSPDPSTSQKVIPESEDSPLSDDNVNGSPISSTIKVVDDVEASALARFQILRGRDENSKSMTAKGRYNWPLLGDPTEGGSLDVTVKPYSQSCSIVSDKSKAFGSLIGRFDYETMKELDLCAADDRGMQSCQNNRFECLLPSGWCDGSSSDWEDVPKDEFASQN